ncbi:MAG: rhomboid family intramembrane serine protease [Candidatus Eisenbacteria bacterium]|uniref:Rhomboid family intramembrane serine protease n=1 Tax=Eiseniibacteriota bacterium TaxID=2212470 RepID=A0A933SG31_UNCEI|nr:rhomboid family intramembrane serine protease [Candidatus Eisenbacteria bacterium]
MTQPRDPDRPDPYGGAAPPPTPLGSPVPPPAHDPDSAEAFAAELEALGYIPPDPDEPPPLDLWASVGDVLPWGSLLLLFSWAAMYLLLGAHGALTDSGAMFAWGANATQMPLRSGAWRWLASTFLHAGAAHLFFNAVTLAVLGPAVERIFARWGFWIVFVVGGAFASFASMLAREAFASGQSLSVGGSGALFALGGALLVVVWRLRHRLAVARSRALVASVLYLIAPGFAAGYAHPGTDNVAHAGGLIAGLVLGALLPTDARLEGRGPNAALKALAFGCVLALLASLALAVKSGLAR